MFRVLRREACTLALNVVHVLITDDDGIVFAELARDVVNRSPFGREARQLSGSLTDRAVRIGDQER